MPYIIKTSIEQRMSAETVLSTPTGRTAVATLEEARERMSGVVGDAYIRTGHALDAEWAAFLDTELPGTVGPLPDGTVIEVEQIGYIDLADRANVLRGEKHTRILAAFNSRRGDNPERALYLVDRWHGSR